MAFHVTGFIHYIARMIEKSEAHSNYNLWWKWVILTPCFLVISGLLQGHSDIEIINVDASQQDG